MDGIMGLFALFLAIAVAVDGFGFPKKHHYVSPGARRKYLRNHPWCEYHEPGRLACGRPAVHVHHKVFRSQGGGDEDSNLMSLCALHHLVMHGIRVVS